jgi:prepilin-type N-terminal cleavage/methylation domain-containing protein
MKKSSNKGFSLIELIIAIAILVILTGLLAPQFMRYIEKSREAKDVQTLDTVYEAVQVALVDESAYQEVMAANKDMTKGISLAELLEGTDAFSEEVQLNLGSIDKDASVLKLSSKKAKACATNPEICVMVNNKITTTETEGVKSTSGSEDVAVGVYYGTVGDGGSIAADFNLGIAVQKK